MAGNKKHRPNRPSKPKGYNVHQMRLYSITDDLVTKQTFIEHDEAKEFILESFADEHDGPLYSRGSIRSLDPISKGWIVPQAMNNPKALLFEGSLDIVDK